MDIERFSDRSLERDTSKPPLTHFIRMDSALVPAELAEGFVFLNSFNSLTCCVFRSPEPIFFAYLDAYVIINIIGGREESHAAKRVRWTQSQVKYHDLSFFLAVWSLLSAKLHEMVV
ncbi:hypothetical protein RDI58_003040 [Solanum bulbocastanum]|uniref:Uncharacterized protein n=1 Tax=Solanum bulbocastanum TaxID=147425 RepID=A0AAN8UFL1_SOLBU